MALVTVQDLKNYMDITFSNRQEEAAQMILDGLHGELEALLRRPVEVRSFTETWVIPENVNPYVNIATSFYSGNTPTSFYASQNRISWSAAIPIYLDQSPVVSVESVTRTPAIQALSGGSQTLEEGTDFVATEFGIFVHDGMAGDKFVIEYTAGLPGENLPLFKLFILRAASREVQNLHDDTVGLKDLEVRNVAIQDIGFTEAEERRLKRYKRQRI